MGRITTGRLVALSLVIHILLVLYAHHVDTHPEQFGGLKYTDVDWRVVSDGAALIFDGHSPRAQGWLVKALGLTIGDPYARPTFRYTPLLPLLLSPTLLHPLIGKLILTAISLLVPLVLLSGPRPSPFWPTHLLSTLNPFVLSITTRGSPEAIVVLLVVSFLACLQRARAPAATVRGQHPSSVSQRSETRWETRAALLYVLAVSWKVYPIIYAPAIWAHLATTHGWRGRGIWHFGIITLSTFILVNGSLWSIWGQPFLHNTYLYHLSRLDHRHNFSPYFYPIYLSSFSSIPNLTRTHTSLFPMVEGALRHPLASFVPQFGLVTIAGLILTSVAGIELAVFIQTAGFVIFNKVCTSQYFIWFIPLIPPLLSHLRITRTRTVTMISLWMAAQAMWLATAYQLEFLAQPVHMPLWMASIGLLVISTWVLGELIEGWEPLRLVKDGEQRLGKVD